LGLALARMIGCLTVLTLGGVLLVALLLLLGPVLRPTPFPPEVLTPAAATASPPAQPPAFEAEIVSEGLNARSGPSVEYPVIDSTTLRRGMRLPVLAVDPDSGWLKVRLPDGREGCISGDLAYVTIRENPIMAGD
jgi:hypothetical protein